MHGLGGLNCALPNQHMKLSPRGLPNNALEGGGGWRGDAWSCFLAALDFAANLKSVLAARWRAAALVVQVLAVVVGATAALFAMLYAEAGRRPWWLPLLKLALWAFVAVSLGGTVAGWRRWVSARAADNAPRQQS